MLFDDFGGWPRILFLTLGLIVMVAGFVQLRREFRAKSRRAESPPPRRLTTGGETTACDGGHSVSFCIPRIGWDKLNVVAHGESEDKLGPHRLEA